MKKSFKLLMSLVIAVALPMCLTSCEDILGHWEKPAPTNVTPSDGGSDEAAMLGTPLTFEAKTAGAKVTFIADDDAIEKTVEYSEDGGATWTSESTKSPGISVTLNNVGDKVMFRGTNATYSDGAKYNSFSCSADCYVYGNIMSLINKDNFATNKELTTMFAFYQLFLNNEKLYSHDTQTLVLPATTLADACYQKMFYGCTKFAKAPNLPATDLTNNCYEYMFKGCTALTSTQEELPATTLQQYCYQSMFEGCSALTKAPKLPATTLAGYCYQSMFRDCTNLNEAWVKADYVNESSCYYMFNGCTDAPTSIFHSPDAANWKTKFSSTLGSWAADTTY